MISRIIVRLNDTIGTISPNIYGSQIEKGLLGSVEGGIWVGPESKIPNIDGIRKDVVEALKKIHLPLVRMGGCFAELYHWKDGIGPRNKRPKKINFWRGGREGGQPEESNEFGTDEFVHFCHLIGAEPYLCINLSTGTPEEAFSWVEYCNYDGDTYYTRLRKRYGNQKPHNVRYWEIGNENMGCGGLMEPEQYARDYRKIALNIRKFSTINLELVACGLGHSTTTGSNWNTRFLNTLCEQNPGQRFWQSLIDGLVIHSYIGMNDRNLGGDVEFTDDEYYNLFGQFLKKELEITKTINAINYYTGGQKDIKIHVNEWTVLHPSSPITMRITLRTALASACFLNLFNKYCSKITQASAQIANFALCLLRTKDEKILLTPYYHVADMYKGHYGNRSLRVDTESPLIKSIVDNTIQEIPSLDVSASINEDNNLVMTLVNRHLIDDLDTEICIEGGNRIQNVRMRSLTAENVNEFNSFGEMEKVRPTDWMELDAKIKDNKFKYTVPRHSLNEILIQTKNQSKSKSN